MWFLLVFWANKYLILKHSSWQIMHEMCLGDCSSRCLHYNYFLVLQTGKGRSSVVFFCQVFPLGRGIRKIQNCRVTGAVVLCKKSFAFPFPFPSVCFHMKKTTFIEREMTKILEKISKQTKAFASWSLLTTWRLVEIGRQIWPTSQLQFNRMAHSSFFLMPSHPSMLQIQTRKGVRELWQSGAGSLAPCLGTCSLLFPHVTEIPVYPALRHRRSYTIL